MFSVGWSDDRHHMPTSSDVLVKPLKKNNRSCSIYTLCRTIGQIRPSSIASMLSWGCRQRDAATSLSPVVSCTTWPRHTPAACQRLSSPKRFPSSPWQRAVTKAMSLGTPSSASSSDEHKYTNILHMLLCMVFSTSALCWQGTPNDVKSSKTLLFTAYHPLWYDVDV